VTYPFIKRFLSVPQMYLASRSAGASPWPSRPSSTTCRGGLAFVLANMIWVTVYDTIYAMVDRDDDVRIASLDGILFGARTGTSSQYCRRSRSDALPRRPPVEHGRLVLRGPDRRRVVLRAPSLDDPKSRPRGVLPGIPGQSLFRLSVFIGILLNYQFAH